MLRVENPKQARSTLTGKDAWYPYYAGFSTDFARNLLSSAHLDPRALVIDPWNGSGTTTAAAKDLGFRTIGLDLNPAMVVTAKARCLNPRERNSLKPIALDILSKMHSIEAATSRVDPLCNWFSPRSVEALRRVEAGIQRLLIGYPQRRDLSSAEAINQLSDLAAFYYTALFRTVRKLVRRFIPSNPTWTKKPIKRTNRVRPSPETVVSVFKSEVELMIQHLHLEKHMLTSQGAAAEILLGNSEDLQMKECTVDLTLSSPPYCTRIDYAIATMPELAVLGFNLDGDFQDLRRKLLGTSTVPRVAPVASSEWGERCNSFLGQVANHSSKASGTYYYKNHAQYFFGIFRSLAELVRVTKPSGRCVIVVQDSYYKEIHNDLPTIMEEMMYSLGLRVEQRVNFKTSTVMANLHSGARKYKNDRIATESVISFRPA